jgi:hypothetical protein
VQAREQPDFDDDDDGFQSFKLSNPALYELLKTTQEKVMEIERESTALDVSEMELQPRGELDSRVRAEEMLVIKLAKDEIDQLRRGETLKLVEK